MPHEAIDAKSPGEKSLIERGRNLGDPRKDDAEADAAADDRAGRRRRDGQYGRGVDGKPAQPIEGTSATNLGQQPGTGVLRCKNPYVGYGQCDGEIDEQRGECRSCGMPTTTRYEPLISVVRADVQTPNGSIVSSGEGGAFVGSVTPAHRREAARMAIQREVVAAVALRHNWSPESSGEFAAMPPQAKSKWSEIQREVDAECERRFRLAGLMPRGHAHD